VEATKVPDDWPDQLNPVRPNAEALRDASHPEQGAFMHLSLKRARRAAATAMTVAVAATGVLTAACTPQSAGYKVVSGTVKGADGKIVDVMMGYSVLDAYGNKINLGGVGSYSSIARLNHCVPASGATKSQKCKRTGYVTGYNWSILLPPNAARLYIEVYPKDTSSSNWYSTVGYNGPFAGTTDTSTYGEVWVDNLQVSHSISNVSIVLPKVCGKPGGTTGSIAGHISGWPIGHTGVVNAWSMAANTLPTQGFSSGAAVDGNGNYRIDKLQSGQRYGLIAGGPGFSRNEVNYVNATTSATLIPSACAVKTYNF
jgi:hypothetical protein